MEHLSLISAPALMPPTSVGADAERASRVAGDSAAVHRLRACADLVAAGQAGLLVMAAAVLVECESQAPVTGLRVADRAAFVRDLATAEIACAVGTSEHEAAGLVALAERLVSVMPRALTALREGRVDLRRVRVLADLTSVLDDAAAARVAAELVDATGEGPWDGPSPRAWRARVERAVVRADTGAAARRRAAAVAARRVQAWVEPGGEGVFQLRADPADVALVNRVVDDLAAAGPSCDEQGARLTLDQRRADAVVALFRRVQQGVGVPVVGGRRPALGVVLHADTLFGSGARRTAAGELRGFGRPEVLDPGSARALAERQLRDGCDLHVLVVDGTGALQQVVRFGRADAATVAATPQGLAAAVRERLPSSPALTTDRYEPTAAIVRHVQAAAPTCSFYDCGRPAARCDLDHDEPWPRGPTSVTNLDPKCRRHHQAKTHGAVRSHLRAVDVGHPRSVTWTLLSGLRVTTGPDSLPGCAEGGSDPVGRSPISPSPSEQRARRPGARR